MFITGIGSALSNGEKHDERAPGYDGWSTVTGGGQAGLNGDIPVWYPVLRRFIKLSSMGIRVDEENLLRQLRFSGQEGRQKLYLHQQLLSDKLPLGIDGGIGQSRLCMVSLQKTHIDEIQASIWPEDMREACNKLDIRLIQQSAGRATLQTWRNEKNQSSVVDG